MPQPSAATGVVLGDLVVDVVLLPSRATRSGTDVAGRVTFRQGESAATTARVLARLGMRTRLVTAIGDDGPGRGLAAYLGACGVDVRAVRIRGARTGRLGVIVEPSGERTFVADRGAMLRLRPRHLRARWFAGAQLLHLPAYSMLGEGLAATSRRAAGLAHASGGRVSVDLASAGFLEDYGVDAVLETVAAVAPDVILANEAETSTVVRGSHAGLLLDLAPLVVLKLGRRGAAILGRAFPREVGVAARRRTVADTTGAGDGFDAGFLAAWLPAAPRLRAPTSTGSCTPFAPGIARPPARRRDEG